MESQAIEEKIRLQLKDFKDFFSSELGNMRAAMERLAESVATIAVHNERLVRLESDVRSEASDIKDIWIEINRIKKTCVERNAVYEYGKRHMAEPPRSHDDWWNTRVAEWVRLAASLFLGGVLGAAAMRLADKLWG